MKPVIFVDAQINVTAEKPWRWIGEVVYKGFVYPTRPRRTQSAARREAEKLAFTLGAKVKG